MNPLRQFFICVSEEVGNQHKLWLSSTTVWEVPAAGLLAANGLVLTRLCTVFHCHTDLHHSNTMNSHWKDQYKVYFRGTSRCLSDNLKPLQQYYQLSLGVRREGCCNNNNQTSLSLRRRVCCLTVGTDMKIFLYVKCEFFFFFFSFLKFYAMLQSVYEAKATIAHVMCWFSYQFLMQYATFGLFVNLPVLYEIKRACLEHLLLCLIQLNQCETFLPKK